MKTNIKYCRFFPFNTAQKRMIYFAASEAPKGPEGQEVQKEAPVAKPDLAKPEERQKLYLAVETKIAELQAQKNDKRADRLQRVLDACRDAEKPGSVEDPQESAGRLYDRLDRILHPEKIKPISDAEAARLSATADKMSKDMLAAFALGAGTDTGAPKVEAAAPKVEAAAPKVEAAAPKVEAAAPKVEAVKAAPAKAMKLPPGLPKTVADQVVQQLDAKSTEAYASGNVRVTFKYEGKDYVAVKFFGPAVQEPGHVRYEITPGSANA